ncbi:Aste57867_19228 [Aphanomyces stellatus]|uniref:Aste57867_15745 protein n=1 Tax=Aphanomyces stellatus TaxID=120398 RepID=A0A485L5P2_9STRA|nr:hypothetical protein As57867_019164 [Aphanomyces stellatus]KAF0693268.1 hypothetical protein As57867_015689 [Aphanomyces stellatus]VFT92534.1 Aste57867_15745 [Aphanomyces stellatus]VFT95949.1 Aste57867_19228 [Aphanomyces stellatus]
MCLQNARERGYVETIAIYHPNVVIDVANVEIDWLLRHIQSPGAVEWRASFPSSPSGANGAVIPMDEWFVKWVQLPFGHIHLDQCKIKGFAKECVEAVLPQLRNDRLIQLNSTAVSAGAVFELAASSPMLVELVLSTQTRTIVTSYILSSMIQWLQFTHVHTFGFGNWLFDDQIDEFLRDDLYTTLFHHPTLTTLTLYNCALPALDVLCGFDLNPSLRHLYITKCCMSPPSILGLASVIEQSDFLETLTLDKVQTNNDEPNDEYLYSFMRLLEAIAQCWTLKHVMLDCCGIHDSCWQVLGPLLQTAHVQGLSLAENCISDDGVKWIGQAILVNASMQTLNLSRNRISKDGMLTLLEIVQGCQLQIEMDREDIEGCYEDQEMLTLKSWKYGVRLEFRANFT